MSLFSNFVPFKNDLEQYMSNCKDVFTEIGNTSSASLVDGFIKDIEELRYNITIVGSLKRGKSTLLNALIERNNDDISPISSNVCTSAIIKYLDKDLPTFNDGTEKAVVYFEDGKEPQSIPFNRLRSYVTEEQNPQNRKKVRLVEVFGDFPAWSKAVTFVDSPGQKAIYEYHDVLLSDFLPYTDAIIFLVAADIPLDGGDIALLKELDEQQKNKIFFVLTKIDSIENPEDLQDVIDYVTAKIEDIGIPCNKLYTVSAKPVYDALVQGVSGVALENLKAENGIIELEEDLEKFIIAESDQTAILRSRVEALCQNTSMTCDKFISESNDVLKLKSYDMTKLQTEQETLSDTNINLQKNTQKTLKKFSRDWSRAINSFQRKFSSKAPAIDDKIIDFLNRGGLTGALFQSFKLKKQVQSTVTMELHPLLLSLEENLEELITALNDELDDEISLYIRRNTGIDGASALSSAAAFTALAGTVSWGFSTAQGAFGSAKLAFDAWQTAAAVSTTAKASNTIAATGFFTKLWRWSFGSKEAVAVATATANTKIAASSAVIAGATAVASLGISIAVTLIVQKILHIGLVNFQANRIPNITEKIMFELEESLFKSLEAYKDAIVSEYTERIEEIISDNTERLEEIKQLISSDDPEERLMLTTKVKKVEKLLSECGQIRKQIPLYTVN